jgi:hypothetical protein
VKNPHKTVEAERCENFLKNSHVFTIKRRGGGESMIIEKQVMCKLPMAYAVRFFHINERLYAVAASEGEDRCVFFDPEHPSEMETVWDKSGGTMSIAKIESNGGFLSVQNFFKGFNSKTAKIVWAKRSGSGKWDVSDFLPLPYVHRFDVVEAGTDRFLLACTLCDDKDFKEDWTRPGRVWLGKFTEDGSCKLETFMSGITKNHGFFHGSHNHSKVILVTGQEGIFEIKVPVAADDSWSHEKIFDKEVSEAIFVDLDEDGHDELVTIEPFHGSKVTIYKSSPNGYREVYSMPVNFGHVIWGGSILGKPSLLVGYRLDNAPLLLLRKKPIDGWYMEQQIIDEHIGPTNISVESGDKECLVLCSAGGSQEILLYRMRHQ